MKAYSSQCMLNRVDSLRLSATKPKVTGSGFLRHNKVVVVAQKNRNSCGLSAKNTKRAVTQFSSALCLHFTLLTEAILNEIFIGNL